jgi:hypothetical protein
MLNAKIKKDVFHTWLWDRQGDECEQVFARIEVQYPMKDTRKTTVQTEYRANYSPLEVMQKADIHKMIVS